MTAQGAELGMHYSEVLYNMHEGIWAREEAKKRRPGGECAGAQEKKVMVDDQGASRVKRASAISATPHLAATRLQLGPPSPPGRKCRIHPQKPVKCLIWMKGEMEDEVGYKTVPFTRRSIGEQRSRAFRLF